MIDSYVINLDRRPDRLLGFNAAVSWPPQLGVLRRVPAVDGKLLDFGDQMRSRIDAWHKENIDEESKLRGIVGAALSHLAAWKLIAAGSSEWACVFEDDARPLTPDAAETIRKLAVEAPDHAGLIFLTDWCHFAGFKDRVRSVAFGLMHRGSSGNRLIGWDRDVLKTTEAYMISRHAATVLGDRICNDLGAIDAKMMQHCGDLAPHFPTRPLFTQADRADTDIQTAP